MKVTISFKNINHTRSLDGKIKISLKTWKVFEGKTNLKWSCHFDDGHYYTEVSLTKQNSNIIATQAQIIFINQWNLHIKKFKNNFKKKRKVEEQTSYANKNVTIQIRNKHGELEENFQKQKHIF